MAYKHGAYATVDTSRAKRLKFSTSQIVTPSTPENPNTARKVQFLLESGTVKLAGVTFRQLEESIQLAGAAFSLNEDQTIRLKGCE